jgi:hypothetical protein
MAERFAPGVTDQFTVPDKDRDPNFVYRWCNTDDRAMLKHQEEGYEVVHFEKPEVHIPGRPGETPAVSENTRRRGRDLLLMRIPRARWEATVGARRKTLQAQHEGLLDDAVERTNENASRALHGRYGNRYAKRGLAFQTSDAGYTAEEVSSLSSK